MAKKDISKYRMDVEEFDWIDDIELPDLEKWEGVQRRPKSLGDLDPDAQQEVEDNKAEFLSLGELAYLNEISETEISDDAISTPKLQAGAVEAANISVASLSAIEANLGSVTSGTVTGALIRTSSSGSRVEMRDDDDNIIVYDSGGDKRLEIEQEYISFFDPSEDIGGFITSNDGDEISINPFDPNSSGVSYIFSDNPDAFFAFNSGVSIGTSIFPWGDAYLRDIQGQDIEPVASGFYDLGTSSRYWANVYTLDLDVDQIYAENNDAVEFMDPILMDHASSPPGSASGKEGYVYYDTSKETLVFSDGSGWFACVANVY